MFIFRGVNIYPGQIASVLEEFRDVDSEFPATQLSENNDYASNASDREFETLHEGDYLDRVEKLQAYNDIDLQIVNDMETMFSCLFTSHMNGGMGL